MIEDTIAALVTPIGAAGVGIIRISGSDAKYISDKLFVGKNNKKLIKARNYSINYGHLFDESGKLLDECLALVMNKPTSYTGEDVIEFQCHGGIVVLRQVLQELLKFGARLAEPGEFTKRAFLNGKLDLAQAEAIMDIINAKTEKSTELALDHLGGNLSLRISNIRKKILELIAFLEAEIDFPEEDIEHLSFEEQGIRVSYIIKEIENLLRTSKKGRILRDGLKTAIIGKPNVGKSSLLNALLREKRAIVTDIPGTTRDIIEEFYNLNGIPLKLIDTAGIRETDDIVEKIGVDRSREVLDKADIVLYVLDVVSGISHEDEALLKTFEDKPFIILVNKIDLDNKKLELKSINGDNREIIYVSVKEEVGLDKLEHAISNLVFNENIETKDTTIVTNVRHIDILEKTLLSLKGALNSIQSKMDADFISIDLTSSWQLLGKITGETIEEDLLDQIFSQFCIGK